MTGIISSRMTSLLKKIGIGYEVQTDDEFNAILQSLNLIEDKYSLKKKEKRKK